MINKIKKKTRGKLRMSNSTLYNTRVTYIPMRKSIFGFFYPWFQIVYIIGDGWSFTENFRTEQEARDYIQDKSIKIDETIEF